MSSFHCCLGFVRDLFQAISGTIFGKNGIGNPTTEHESYGSHRILLPGLLDNWGGADPDITGMPSRVWVGGMLGAR